MSCVRLTTTLHKNLIGKDLGVGFYKGTNSTGCEQNILELLKEKRNMEMGRYKEKYFGLLFLESGIINASF